MRASGCQHGCAGTCCGSALYDCNTDCLPVRPPACSRLPQARTRRLAEKRIPKEELEELERRKAAEEAEDRQGTIKMMRWGALLLLQGRGGSGLRMAELVG